MSEHFYFPLTPGLLHGGWILSVVESNIFFTPEKLFFIFGRPKFIFRLENLYRNNLAKMGDFFRCLPPSAPTPPTRFPRIFTVSTHHHHHHPLPRKKNMRRPLRIVRPPGPDAKNHVHCLWNNWKNFNPVIGISPMFTLCRGRLCRVKQ